MGPSIQITPHLVSQPNGLDKLLANDDDKENGLGSNAVRSIKNVTQSVSRRKRIAIRSENIQSENREYDDIAILNHLKLNSLDRSVFSSTIEDYRTSDDDVLAGGVSNLLE